MKTINYEDCYVAYIDILGFKEITENNKWNPVDIYKILTSSKNKRMSSFIYEKETCNLSDKIKSYIMSDSIVYYINSSEKYSLFSLVLNCASLAISLILNGESPIFIRGAIVRERLFCDNDIIFGPALTKAYILENNFSKYPRIIIDRNLVSAAISLIDENDEDGKIIKEAFEKMIYKDNDEWECIEYLFPVTNKEGKQEKPFLKSINKEIDVAIDVKIREKLVYLIKHIETNEKRETK